jgi:hypothetical protein
MKNEETTTRPEEKLGHALVKARIINENQLRTALDYQRSLGGSLVDVVAKLGFARPSALQRFLAESNIQGSGGTGAAATAEADATAAAGDTKLKKEASRPAPTAVDESEEHEEEDGAAGGDPGQDPAASAGRTSEPVLDALITLLIKKGVIRRRELEDLLRGGGGD